MKLDKKQLPQLAVLGVLVVLCVGVVSFQMVRPSQSQKPSKPVAAANDQPARTDADGTDDPTAAEAEMDMAQAGTFPALTVVPARRDPFTPQIGDVAPAASPAPQPTRAVRPPINTSPVPPFPVGSIEPVPGSQPLTVQQIAPEPDPDFVLTGVIRGQQNVAIIRVGENGRYVVKQGQFVDGRYKVLSVSEDGAVLAYKNRRIHVKLGGAKNAS